MDDEIKKIIYYSKNPTLKNFLQMKKDSKFFFGISSKIIIKLFEQNKLFLKRKHFVYLLLNFF